MSHLQYKRITPYMDIYIYGPSQRRIVIRQKWRFTFISDPRLPSWGFGEMFLFKSLSGLYPSGYTRRILSCTALKILADAAGIDSGFRLAQNKNLLFLHSKSKVQTSSKQKAKEIIEREWSGRMHFESQQLKGGEAVKRGHLYPVLVELLPVIADEHWEAIVQKFKRPPIPTQVKWNDRKVFLKSRDLTSFTNSSRGVITQQTTVSHEFGHTFGNNIPGNKALASDEYRFKSLYKWDEKSMMNHGNELRSRHFCYVLEECSRMVARDNFNFTIKSSV